ncbi:hypothetical protein LguiA_002245 [Lonicera macranthoides]
MLLYRGFTSSFVTFPLLIPSHEIDFVHKIVPLVVPLIVITLSFIIPCNQSFIRQGEKFNSRVADQFCRQFTFAETRAAIRNFSHRFVIGKGGFGKVFKGVIDNGATTVAIKRLDPMSKQGGKEFSTEIEMLSKFRHSHVVSFIGYCDNKDEMFLVYEYMENGSLADHLYKKRRRGKGQTYLDWETHLRIAINTARGIAYIHTQTCGKLVHGNIKASNIFLNSQQHGCVSEHGLETLVN